MTPELSFIFTAMLDAIIDFDKRLLLLLNSWNAPWLDQIMMALTNGVYWLPLFLLIIGAIIYRYKLNAIIVFVYLIIVIVLTDQISSSIIKPWIGRLRPSHDPDLKDLVHIVNNYRGGLYSFVSSHATNAFGVATFLFLAVRSRVRWIWVMFIWASIFAYTRIYLGVHYPLDILCGGVLGAFIAYAIAQLGRILPGKIRLE